MRKLTFTAFSDLHDCPGVLFTNAAERLRRIGEAALRGGSSLILHAGDFCHDYTASGPILAQYRALPLPAYHTLGNHDCEMRPWADVVAAYRMPGAWYFADEGGFRFLFLDTNFYWDGERHRHFSAGNYIGLPKECLYVLPPEQLTWLEQTLDDSPYPCVIVSHHSLVRPIGGVRNAAAAREIFTRSGKVMLCINGHHHRDHLCVMDGVCFLELNSASYNWLQKPHRLFPESVTVQYSLADHMAIYNDPLYAAVTLSDDGTVEIRGMRSSFYLGVSREVSGNEPLDACGCPARPVVSSVTVRGCNAGRTVGSPRRVSDTERQARP